MKRLTNTICSIVLYSGLFLNANPQGTNNSKMILISTGFYESLFNKGEEQKVEKFYLDVYPVTNKEFLEFVKANPKWRKTNIKKIFADESYLANWKSDLELGEKANRESPVTYVSWFAAKAFAEWIGKRLPTVAEWEYVASASKDKKYAVNDKEVIKKILDWYSSISAKEIPPVGSTEKNYWGVYDMHGLIWEWTYDFNTSLVTGESRGDGDLERNIFCGSGSASAGNAENYPAFMRYGFRSSLKANYTTRNLGFRCAKNFK